MSLACASCPVRDSAACSVLEHEEREALARAGRTRFLKRGETLFRAGDTETSCATLLTGALKVTSYADDGTERILALIHPSGFVGELFRPFSDYDVVALGDCELCVFSQRDMESALKQYPALTEALFRRAQEDLHSSRELLALTANRSAKDRVSAFIMSLAHAASNSPCHPSSAFDMPLTRGEIANLLGLTIETVSRQLSALEKDGIILRKGSRGIELLDPARLHLVND